MNFFQDLWDRLILPLDLYCERTGGSMLAEPLNLISNLAFILFGFVILRKAQKELLERHRHELSTLAAMAIAVGIGSSLFHSMPNLLTQIADVGPIALYIFTSLILYFLHLKRLGRPIRTTVLLASGTLASAPLLVILGGIRERFHNGEFYLGIPFALIILAACDTDRIRKRRLNGSAALFTTALAARTLDSAICGPFPLGLHWLWHLLTAWVAYRVATLTVIDGGESPMNQD